MDHEYTAKTPVTFHVEITRGTCETEVCPLDEFLTDEQIQDMTKEEIDEAICVAHADWVYEQVQDGACYEIG